MAEVDLEGTWTPIILPSSEGLEKFLVTNLGMTQVYDLRAHNKRGARYSLTWVSRDNAPKGPIFADVLPTRDGKTRVIVHTEEPSYSTGFWRAAGLAASIVRKFKNNASD